MTPDASFFRQLLRLQVPRGANAREAEHRVIMLAEGYPGRKVAERSPRRHEAFALDGCPSLHVAIQLGKSASVDPWGRRP